MLAELAEATVQVATGTLVVAAVRQVTDLKLLPATAPAEVQLNAGRSVVTNACGQLVVR